MFGMMSAHHRDISAMIEEAFLKPPIGEKGQFLRLVGMCAMLCVLWDERNRRVFRGVEQVACLHVSLWASISKTFCNYSLGMILHSWSCVSPFCTFSFLYAHVFFHFFR